MYLKLDIDDVKLEMNDILKFFENYYHLNPYWYKKKMDLRRNQRALRGACAFRFCT